MNRKLSALIALGGGLAGGGMSRFISLAPAFAQATAARQLRAQSFVLVDENNNLVGTFTTSPRSLKPGEQSPAVILLDSKNREIWRAGVSVKILGQS
ncbi:MAG TPA: hypothetical protein VF146_06660 [Bryobacteraceae bacterium]